MRLKCTKHGKRSHVFKINGEVKAFHQTRAHVPCDSIHFSMGPRTLSRDEVVITSDTAILLLEGIFLAPEFLNEFC